MQYNHDAVEAAAAEGVEIDPEDGLEASFDVVHSIDEQVTRHTASLACSLINVDEWTEPESGTPCDTQVRTGMWVGACYIYTNAAWRLNYVVGEEVTTIVHLDKRMYLLGYNTQQQRIYLIDRDYSVVTFSLALPGDPPNAQ